MRMSDCSADGCSSDLLVEQSLRDLVRALILRDFLTHHEDAGIGAHFLGHRIAQRLAADQLDHLGEIGRASCRERVCQYVSISVVAVSLKKQVITLDTFIDAYRY